MTTAPAVEAIDLVKHFGETRAVDGVSFVVPEGSVLGLLGPNGAGKTTLVRMLTTLSVPTSGTGRVAGFDILAQPREVRRSMGLTGQAATVDEILTGRENLQLIGSLYGLPKAYVREATEKLFERFDLTGAADRMAKTYSGGMRRRLDLAVSLLAAPPILFLDEPTTGLDPQSRHQTWQLIRGLLEEQTTVLLTTHYLEEAEALADRIAIMHEGLIARAGTLADIVSRQPTRISFRLADDARAGESLAMLRRVGGAGFQTEQRAGGHAVSLETFDAQPLLTQLLGWAHDRTQLADLRVLPGSLEQAFLDVARKDNTPTSLEEAA
jgi:daunorubicin resistance ABC transporter ATP-binding subunit